MVVLPNIVGLNYVQLLTLCFFKLNSRRVIPFLMAETKRDVKVWRRYLIKHETVFCQTPFRKKPPWKGFQAFVIFCTIASQSLYVLSSHPLFLAHPAGRAVAPDWSLNFCSSSVRIFCPKHDYNCSQTDNHYKSIYGPVSALPVEC